MPNHYTTILEFEAPVENIHKIFKNGDNLCEMVMPMPAILRKSCTGFMEFTINGERVRVNTWYKDDTTERPLTEAERAEIAATGSSDWYEWANKNWGTKWGTYNTQVSPDEITFDSAWGPPTDEVMQLICDKLNAPFTMAGKDEFEEEWTVISHFKPNKMKNREPVV